jgi:hypothetical protein
VGLAIVVVALAEIRDALETRLSITSSDTGGVPDLDEKGCGRKAARQVRFGRRELAREEAVENVSIAGVAHLRREYSGKSQI